MRKRRAFTLVELLVVVTIIALLIALLVPFLGHAKDSAKSAKCQSNLQQIGISLSSYAIGNGVLPTPGLWNDTGGKWFLPNANLDWPERLIVDGDVAHVSTANYNWSNGGVRGVFICPSHDPLYQNGSGTPNDVDPDFHLGTTDTHDSYGLALQAQGAKPANINPSHIIAADGNVDLPQGDCGEYFSGYTELGPADYTLATTRHDYGVFQRHMGTRLYRIPTTAGSYSVVVGGQAVRNRDGHGGNYLMGDGHVEWSVEYGHICSTTSGANRPAPLNIWQHP